MYIDTLFSIFALVAVAGSLGLVLFRHPMRSALCLAVTMISLAGIYALLSAKLIFLLQLIVYAGAVMAMIVFIIMFLNLRDKDLPEEKERFTYFIGGAVVLIPVAWFMIKVMKSIPEVKNSIVGNGFGGIKEVGQMLFTSWLVPFEIISLLLLVTLIGAVVLAGIRRESND